MGQAIVSVCCSPDLNRDRAGVANDVRDSDVILFFFGEKIGRTMASCVHISPTLLEIIIQVTQRQS